MTEMIAYTSYFLEGLYVAEVLAIWVHNIAI